jgi:mRNA interferase RelE/StbE
MSLYTVKFSAKGEKSFRKLPIDAQRRILSFLVALGDNPRSGNAAKLKGMDAYRFRIGVYRVIYEIHDDSFIVLILNIGHRRDVYRATK